MENYTENDTFEFGNNIGDFTFNSISGLGESNYENEELFNTEVAEKQEYNNISNNINNQSDVSLEDREQLNIESNFDNVSVQNAFEDNSNPFVTHDSLGLLNKTKEELNVEDNQSNPLSDTSVSTNSIQENYEEIQNVNELNSEETQIEPTIEVLDDNSSPERNINMSNNDLSDLTEFKEENVGTSDIKTLFDRVGVNVKEASDIFKRNTEMKEKLDARFEELKKLQLEVSKNKQDQYDEINSYKEEVLDKLNEKKQEIENRINKLKDYQTKLEKEKEEFEQYRKKEKEEIERVQKEVQEAYDSRREELRHIEDVLRKQKDSLDEERSQLSLDKIQYETDKNELANNLLKFNEIVDSFTKGIDKIDKE